MLVERRTADSLINMGVLARGPVAMTNLASLLVGFGQFGVFLLGPRLVQTPTATGYGFGGDATLAGLVMLPGSLTMLAAGPLSGRLSTRFDGRTPLALGSLITGTGMLGLAARHDSHFAVLGFTTLAFTGVGLSFAAMPNLIVDSVEPARTGEVTGVNTLVRAVGASLGTQLIAGVLANGSTGPHPTAHSYTVSFAVGAMIAAAAAVFIPRPRDRHRAPGRPEEPGPRAHTEDTPPAPRPEPGKDFRSTSPAD